MQFNGEANNQDLVSHTRFWADATSSSYSDNAITRAINIAYHQTVVLIQGADGLWEFDDSNNTTQPIARADLVKDQREYTIDDSMIAVDRVEAKRPDGTVERLHWIDLSQINVALEEYEDTSGDPKEYDKRGRTLWIFPASDQNVTKGLIMHGRRHANIFDPSDTTKEPGFASAFHSVLALKAALPYVQKYKKDRVKVLEHEIAKMDAKIEEFYSRRNRDLPKRLEPKRVNPR